MNRLSTSKRLKLYHFQNHCRNTSWKIFSSSWFSTQAATSTQQCRISSGPPSSDFDSHTYSALIQRCVQHKDPRTAMGLHCNIIKKGNCLDLFATNILLNAYGKAEFLRDAIKLFDEMSDKNTVSFVTLIQGYSQKFMFGEALSLFSRLHKEGHELNPFAFSTILKLLVSVEWPELGRCIHACVLKLGLESNPFVGTALIDAYSVCGCVGSAREVFECILCKDLVTYTGMIVCYADNECLKDAMEKWSMMKMAGFKPNNYTFAGVLKACSGLGTFDTAMGIHGCALKSGYELDIYVGVALLDLYTQYGDIDDAMLIFEEMPKMDVIPWSFMIGRFAQNDQSQEAIDLFCRMRRAFVMPNQFTFASVLQACATMESLNTGRQIHGHVLKLGLDSNVFVANVLMDVYAKCGRIDNAEELFAETQNRNEVSWNTMIVGYMQLGDGENALALFLEVLRNQVEATEVAYSSALRACATLAALDPGVQIHSVITKTSYQNYSVVANALIDMYAKCGRIKDAQSVFDTMKGKDIVSWNTMVSGYSMHCLGAEALKIYDTMLNEGFKPNNQTFVSVLSACSNSRLVDQAQAYFKSMVQDHGIEPCMEHYTSLVWLLGRSGHLHKAVKLIEEIPTKPSALVWRALLSACVVHGNTELGRTCAQNILEMEPQDEATHVLLANVYAGAGKWENVASIRKNMKIKGVKKEPGLSWIENQGTVHYFTVGDMSHTDMKLIGGILEWLNLKTRRAGYMPDRNIILLDVDGDEKDRRLWVHSERLALAYGLIRLPKGSIIRIIKNLRICSDCHNVMKVISKILQRDLVIRDMNRFHHFRDGVCSCSDYW